MKGAALLLLVLAEALMVSASLFDSPSTPFNPYPDLSCDLVEDDMTPGAIRRTVYGKRLKVVPLSAGSFASSHGCCSAAALRACFTVLHIGLIAQAPLACSLCSHWPAQWRA